MGGVRNGIRRTDAGVRLVNGHYPINPDLRQQIVQFMDTVLRPVTADEVASVLHYSRNYIRNVMRWLAIDGDILIVLRGHPGNQSFRSIYALPTTPIPEEASVANTIKRKRCSRCRETKSIEDFGRDSHNPDGRSYACRDCRSAVPPEKRRGRRRQRVAA